jgi:hypothetical protein
LKVLKIAQTALSGRYSMYTGGGLSYEEGPAESWVSTIMVRLQAEVFEQAAVRQTPTQTLQEELVLAESELEGNVVEIRETEEQ